ncbi:MAG: hypothetical protein MAGBODY4_00285 [Candidatus Marinimicrobia bacterium]|nr:hypothetical protein [Candidatus Neomarinimicrobiota bacterium]
MHHRRIWTVFSILILFGIVAIKIQAHPGFARKYRMSCTTCHDPAPRLKDFGEEYAGNGFVMEGQEPSRFHLNTGDPNLLLQALPPVGFRLDAYAHFEPGGEGESLGNDLRTPYNLKFITGGRLTEMVSYYFYFFFSERGEVAGIEDAYLYFRNFLGSPIGLAVGQFQVSDPLFKRELRLTFEDYQIYKTQVGEVPIDLAYDRGLMASYTAPWGSDFVFELVNGNGIDPASDYHNFDNDSYKNSFLRWSHAFGPLRIGAFGYYGKYHEGATNTALMYGPDLTLNAGDKLQLNLQYLLRTDDNPMLQSSVLDDPVLTQGGLAEVIYAPQGDRSKWYLIGLYNYRTSDLVSKTSATDPLEYQSVGLTWTYMLATNFRLLTEYNYDIEREVNRVTVGFFSAF